MDIVLPPPGQRLYVARALKTLAMADGELHPQEGRLVEVVLAALGLEDRVEALELVEPSELAAGLTDVAAREALMKRLVVLSTLDTEVSEKEVAMLERFGVALGVEERAVHNLRQHLNGHWRRMAFDLGRRSFGPGKIKSIWREEGLAGLWKIAKTAAGITDASLAARFEALGDLPDGTLGKGLYHQFVDNGFAYPGQKHGPPTSLLFHDVGHVIAGYGTDPASELKVAGFQAGYMEEDPLVMFLMIAMLFQLGHEGIANARGVEAARGMLDVDTFEEAYRRGKAMTVNLLHWDPWPHMDRPLTELRAELGVPPLAS